MKQNIRLTFLLSALVYGLAGCIKEFNEPTEITGSTITQLVAASDNFDILEAALAKANLAGFLANNNSGNYTVFAPNDAAFFTYYKTLVPSVLTETDVINSINGLTPTSVPNIATLAGVLNYHVISSKITSNLIVGRQTFATLNNIVNAGTTFNTRMSFSKTTAGVVINANVSTGTVTGANVIAVDTQASNGVIHTIDRVVIASTTASLISTFGLSINYGQANPALQVGGGTETGGDALGTNYNILAYALNRTGLVYALAPNITPLPDVTVFAPTDNAFRAYLGDNSAASADAENAAIQTIKALSPAALAELANLLKYHVVAGRVLSTDLVSGQPVTTLLSGKTFTVNISGTTFTLADQNAAADPTISVANIFANTGVVHQVNAVLRPN